MKKRVFLTSIILTSYMNAVTVGLSIKKSKENRISPYGIQIFTLSSDVSKEKVYKRIVKKTKLKIYLRETTKHHIVGYYGLGLSKKELKKRLKAVRKYFPDAFIIHTSWYKPKKEFKRVIKRKISKYDISKIMAKANRYFHKGDELNAIKEYEHLIASDIKSQKIERNLCYLYGRHGLWNEAKSIILESFNKYITLYAYAYGAVETMQPGLYDELKDYLVLDRGGRIRLLIGYYFEKIGYIKNAGRFYKMAYEKNRSDMYNLYAYARYLDMIGKRDEAKRLYEIIYYQIDKNSRLYNVIKKIIKR